MTGRSYKLGSRRKDLPGMKNRERDGLMSESRWAWVRNVIGQFVILVDESKNEDESDRTIRLYHPIPNRPAINWNLTALTEDELLKLKELFNLAFEWALPIVQRRDRKAKDAFQNGDDSHARVYRDVSRLVVRKRPLGEHGEGVPQRPGRIPGDSVGPINPDGELRATSSYVSQHNQESGASQDDGSSSNSIS